MKKNFSINYALDVLHRHRAALEANLSIIPEIRTPKKMLPVYKKQLKEVCMAIEWIEIKDRKRKERSKRASSPILAMGS